MSISTKIENNATKSNPKTFLTYNFAVKCFVLLPFFVLFPKFVKTPCCNEPQFSLNILHKPLGLAQEYYLNKRI